MLVIDHQNPLPLYQQIVNGIKTAIARGDLTPGDALPSVRELAQLLTINPNTVARAYRELHQAGVIHVRQGKGARVCSPPPAPENEQLEQIRDRLRRLLADAYHQGVTSDQLLELLDQESQQKEKP